jgi:DNA repair protein RadC
MRLKLNGQNVRISELSVVYKPLNVDVVINCIEDAALFLKNIWYPGLMNVQQLYYVIYLDEDLKVICWHLLNTGSATSNICDKRTIAVTALNVRARSVIIAHNNPAGKTKASAKEMKCFKEIITMLEILNVHFMDYLIITDKSYRALEM